MNYNVVKTQNGVSSLTIGSGEDNILDDYFKTGQIDQNIKLDMVGTDFQKKVWNCLCKIPSGKTLTYSELAIAVGKPKALRAVANACAANKIAILIPCHRIVPKSGGVGGYRWGAEVKRSLLELERVFSRETFA
jgi:O-6-methylguanine DNA methyltransferase